MKWLWQIPNCAETARCAAKRAREGEMRCRARARICDRKHQMTFCLQGIEEMCFLPTQFKTVSESDDCIEFAGCRRGGSQWTCPEIACAPRFHGKLPQFLSFAQKNLSIIICIVFIDVLTILFWRLVLFWKDSTPPLYCPLQAILMSNEKMFCGVELP